MQQRYLIAARSTVLTKLDTVLQATIIGLGSTRGFWEPKGHEIGHFMFCPFSPTVSRGVSRSDYHSYLFNLLKRNIVFV